MNMAHRFSVFFIPITFIVLITLACGTVTQTSVPQISTRTPSAIAPSSIPPTTSNAVFPTVIQPTNPPPTAKPTATEIPATPTPISEMYLGDTSQKYGYALTGVSIEEPATTGWMYEPEAGKKLIAVEVIISNVSGNTFEDLNDAPLLDTEGFVYQKGIAVLEDELDFFALDPGEQIKGKIGYVIPETAVPASIKVATDFMGDNFLQASLLTPPEGHTPVTLTLTPEIPVSKLGDVVEQSGYSITATTIDDPASQGMYYQAPQGYKYVAVELILGNVSAATPLKIYTDFFYLVDNDGFVYPDVQGVREGEIDGGELNVGEKIKGWVTFMIPENAIPAYIKYRTLDTNMYLITGLSK